MIRKKLLIATDSFLPRWDGVSRFLSEIIPRLSKTYDITVLAPAFKGKTRKQRARIIRFPLIDMEFGDISFARPSIKQVKEEVKKADIVWTQTLGPIGMAAIRYSKKLKKPIIAYIHSIEWELASKAVKRFKWFIEYSTKKLTKYLYNKCDLLLVPSVEVAALFKKNGIKPIKSIVHLGTNVNKFKPIDDKNRAKMKLGINPKNAVIGYCGRIGREKDLKTLYRAYAKMKENYKNLLLLIVGGGVREQVEFFQKKKGVIVTGAVNNVVPYLQAMDIYVLPSLTETTSLSTMEAMATGLPVITTKVGYLKEYIKPGQNGMFFAAKNSYSLRLKLEKLMANQKLRMQLGINARKTIMNKYSWERTVKEIEKALSVF